MSLTAMLYKAAKRSGDVRAARKGTLPKRLARRSLWRMIFGR